MGAGVDDVEDFVIFAVVAMNFAFFDFNCVCYFFLHVAAVWVLFVFDVWLCSLGWKCRFGAIRRFGLVSV